ncbi:hypothetical protein [Leptolyngbya sp. FACHB-261]|uniref:hypothetical protein n=1 Tax=Leptolyngbya sp. FACHB-261 TaxID=2692806 RepID=UPI001686F8FC|nr:hypothetical protein [Leptolyngbya sp. FACHB-261]MBD2104917.1 hypothetical protein [Leptolyngbya sp. FACHB-261]
MLPVNLVRWTGTLVVGLAGLAAVLPVQAQSRPSVFNEPPYTRPTTQPSAPSSTAPPVERLQAPSAVVSPRNGQISIVLVNQTGTEVTYQVIGDTSERSLSAESTYTLRDLSVPTNMSFYRPDRGPLAVAADSPAPGELRLVFSRGPSFDVDRTSLTVQASGQAFLN